MIPSPGASVGPAPLLFFYTHLHDAIRSELDSLSEAVLQLENEKGSLEQIANQLTRLRSRYRFLEQVYKYHSNVEDEVRTVSLLNLLHIRLSSQSLAIVGASPTLINFFSPLNKTLSAFSVLFQVVYPDLDLKVKNVTRAYTVEHEDEVNI